MIRKNKISVLYYAGFSLVASGFMILGIGTQSPDISEDLVHLSIFGFFSLELVGITLMATNA